MARAPRVNTKKLVALAQDLGIDPEHVRSGSISSEYNAGDQDIAVSWECTKHVSFEQFNLAMKNFYGERA